MANTKSVRIEACVPYFWHADLTREEAHCFFSWTCAVDGLRLSYTGEEHQYPNEHGGRTTFVVLVIEGVEAVKPRALECMIDALKRVGTVWKADVCDHDNGGARYSMV